jgi:uncharacterized protein (DUF885 family)
MAAKHLLFLLALPLSAADSVDVFFEKFTADWIRQDPNLAVATRYLKGPQQEKIEKQFTPETLAYDVAKARRARKGLAELSKFNKASMSEQQRVSAELLEWQLRNLADEEPHLDFTFPLDQMNGANVSLVANLTVGHPVQNERDASNYIARLGLISERMAEAVAESRRQAKNGILPPTFILEATIKQMRAFMSVSAAQNPFVASFEAKLAALPAAKREQFRARAESITSKRIYPAWDKAIRNLESQLPASNNDAGLWRLKGGPEAYAFFLRRYTTTNLTAEEIHQLGLKQVEKIEAEMDGLLRRLGRNEGSIKDRITALRNEMRYANPTSDASRELIMKDIDAIIRDAERRASGLFDRAPTAAVIARPVARFQEANAAASYSRPPADGSRPGIFQYPLRPERMTKFSLRSTVYHETVPGHHFQIALELENASLPQFRKLRAFGGISALGEGWALYAEKLATELGWYAGDIEGQLGQLETELFRARRLVVDTGIHAMKWTRQQAIDFGIEPSEVERYVVFPGQACSYMIGQLKIMELRDKAQKSLGSKFSLRDFHTAVLNAGTVPLTILERQVDSYIKDSK